MDQSPYRDYIRARFDAFPELSAVRLFEEVRANGTRTASPSSRSMSSTFLASASLDYFDAFVAEWMERGGAEMTQEAREIYKERAEIYRKVGAR